MCTERLSWRSWSLPWSGRKNCTAQRIGNSSVWVCVWECPREKSKNSGNWKTPTIIQFPHLCNTTLETLTGSEGKTLFLWKSGGEEVLGWAPGDLVRNNSVTI